MTDMKHLLLLIISLLTGSYVSGQQVWTLERCINYALKHSSTVKRSETTHAEAEVRVAMAKNNRLPDLNANLNNNMYFGRGISRDGTYTDNNQWSSTASLTTSITVFNGGKINRDIAAQKLNLMATVKEREKACQDISITVTSLFLQVLFDKELCTIAKQQVELSELSLTRAKSLYEVGKCTKEMLVERDALLSTDRLQLTQTRGNLTMSMLTLMQYINIGYNSDFDIESPNIDSIQTSPFMSVSLQTIIDRAISNDPNLAAVTLRAQSSHYNTLSAKSAVYPRISLTAGYGNGYYYSFIPGYDNQSFSQQFNLNSNQYIGLSLSIPIFNRLNTRKQIKLSRLNEQNAEIAVSDAHTTLIKEVETAYFDTFISYQKYLSAIDNLKHLTISFEYESEKYKNGKITLYTFLEARNQLLSTQSQMLRAKYEYLFKTKILETYCGQMTELNANL